MAVSKLQLFLVSLIGAIPGAFLAYLSVMAFLNFAGGSSTLLKATTALLAAVGTFMPILSAMVLLSGRGEGKAAAVKTPPAKETDAVEEISASSDSIAEGASGDSFELDESADEEFTLDEDVFAEEEPKAKGKKKKK